MIKTVVGLRDMVLDDLVEQRVVVKYDGYVDVGGDMTDYTGSTYIGKLARFSPNFIRLEDCACLGLHFYQDDDIALVASGRAELRDGVYYRKDAKRTRHDNEGMVIGRADLPHVVLLNTHRIVEMQPADSYIKQHLKEE